MFRILLLWLQLVYSFLVEEKLCTGDIYNRYNCAPNQEINSTICESRGCCWMPLQENSDEPWCFYPEHYAEYHKIPNENDTYNNFRVSTNVKTFWPGQITELDVQIQECRSKTADVKVARLIILPAKSHRYRHTEEPNLICSEKIRHLKTEIGVNPFYLKIFDDQNTIFVIESTIVYSEYFLEVSIQLLKDSLIYGVGERRGALAIGEHHWQHGVWNRDLPPMEDTNLYGDQPIWLGYNGQECFAGIWWNSNAKSFELTKNRRLSMRSNGGAIDLILLYGGTPDSITQDIHDIVGPTTLMASWTLGYQLCRWGYLSANRTLEVVQELRKAKIPQEVQWNDIDYMNKNMDFTFDQLNYINLPDVINNLHNQGQKYVAILDPAIPIAAESDNYQPLLDGLKKNVFISDHNGKPVNGSVWPGPTYFPDFTHPNTTEYWTMQIKSLHDSGVQFDGLWIDMNEPANFVSGTAENKCTKNILNDPFWFPTIADNSLYHRTLCPSFNQFQSSHYNLHNLYGLHESKATYSALKHIKPNKRPFILSRSTSLTSSRYAAHWTGDNFSKWEDIKYSIAAMISYNIFGIKMVGVDVCGFAGNTQEDLCVRWHQVGSMLYAFYRNHNTRNAKDQHPTVFSSNGQRLIRDAINRRYSLVRYLYHVLQSDGMFIRPMAFEIKKTTNFLLHGKIDTQFMLGTDLLVCPNLSPSKMEVLCYFPRGIWCSLIHNTCIDLKKGANVELSVGEEGLDIFQKYGTVMPMTKPEITIAKTMLNPIDLNVVLDGNGTATSRLLIDDGSTTDSPVVEFIFTVTNNSLNVKCVEVKSTLSDTLKGTLGTINLVNAEWKLVKEVKLNGKVYGRPKMSFSRNLHLKLDYPLSGVACGPISTTRFVWT